MKAILIGVIACLYSSAMASSFDSPVESRFPTDDQQGETHMSAAKRRRIATPFPTLFISGAPYDSKTKGIYTLQQNPVNGYAVYQKHSNDTTWTFYQKFDNRWYLDFNLPSENWQGTVMYSLSEGSSPELLRYSSGVVVAAITIQLRNFPYRNGAFTFRGKLYNKYPVYENVKEGGLTYSLYRRADRKWYVDFNAIGEEWSGTVAYSLQPSHVPYGVEWNS